MACLNADEKETVESINLAIWKKGYESINQDFFNLSFMRAGMGLCFVNYYIPSAYTEPSPWQMFNKYLVNLKKETFPKLE